MSEYNIAQQGLDGSSRGDCGAVHDQPGAEQLLN
jgi:hypothetical protein